MVRLSEKQQKANKRRLEAFHKWKDSNYPLKVPIDTVPKLPLNYSFDSEYLELWESLNGITPYEEKIRKQKETDWGNLRTLLDILDLGQPVKISGTPLSALSFAISDALQILESSLKALQSPRLNKEIKFLEEQKYTKEDALAQDFANVDMPATYWIHRSPIDGHYYKSVSDPLGNPLQVETKFEKRVFSDRDRASLKQGLNLIQEFFERMAAGPIDWNFIKFLSKYQRNPPPTISSSRTKRSQNFHAQKHRIDSKTKRESPARNKKKF